MHSIGTDGCQMKGRVAKFQCIPPYPLILHISAPPLSPILDSHANYPSPELDVFLFPQKLVSPVCLCRFSNKVFTTSTESFSSWPPFSRLSTSSSTMAGKLSPSTSNNTLPAHTHKHTCTHTNIHAHTQTYMHTHKHTCTHINIHACTHTNIHTHQIECLAVIVTKQ